MLLKIQFSVNSRNIALHRNNSQSFCFHSLAYFSKECYRKFNFWSTHGTSLPFGRSFQIRVLSKIQFSVNSTKFRFKLKANIGQSTVKKLNFSVNSWTLLCTVSKVFSLQMDNSLPYFEFSLVNSKLNYFKLIRLKGE